jgi:ribosomal protein S18 acetylase RimI-like enzyme
VTADADLPGLLVGEGDDDLDARLDAGLDAHNRQALGGDDRRKITVRVDDEAGELIGGLRGWSWGTCAGISMLWVREDARRDGWGRRLLAAVEQVARERGCTQVVVSSFTFQAPGFYERCGYVETGRIEGLPVEGAADVQLRKLLVD